MEEKRTIKIGLSTLAVIIAITIIAIVACVVLTMNLLKNTLSTEVSSLKSSVQEFYSADKRYEQYINTYSQKIKYVLEGQSKILINLTGDRQYELPGISAVYLNANNEAYVNIEKNSNLFATYGAEYNIGKEVANIFVCNVGNGGYSYIILLNLDGTVTVVNGVKTEEGKLEVEKIEELKNIVNVLDCEISPDGKTAARQPAFVDIDGNIYYMAEDGIKLY